MTNQQPTCMGCFVNNPNMWNLPENGAWQFPKSPGLTESEKNCLEHLVKAWNIFSELNEKHPQDDAEFCTAIHDAQKMLALRVARRVNTDVWSQWD